MYLIKKLRSQELGSSTIESPKPKRGRYLYMSKDPRILQFFPILSQTIQNDVALLPCVNLDNITSKEYLMFVYHNSQFTDLKFQDTLTKEKGRNEYRIYLNREFDKTNQFMPDDILVIKKERVINDSQNVEDIYFMKLIKPQEQEYINLNTLLQTHSIKDTYAVINQSLPSIDNLINRYNSNNIQVQDTNKTIEQVQKIKTQKTYEDIFNLNSFRDFVLVSYGYRCAITSMVIQWGNFYNLEAAHIHPKSHNGSNMPNNGIAMCRDMHWAFDKGFFTIRDDFSIDVHPLIKSEYLMQYHNQTISVPKDSFMQPYNDNLSYHRKNIYGLFQQTGRL